MYYAREKYYQHIQTEVLKLQKKYGQEPILLYWKAYSLVMCGKLSFMLWHTLTVWLFCYLFFFLERHLEGMRELETLSYLDTRDVSICSAMLHIHAHKKCVIIGKLLIILMAEWGHDNKTRFTIRVGSRWYCHQCQVFIVRQCPVTMSSDYVQSLLSDNVQSLLSDYVQSMSSIIYIL